MIDLYPGLLERTIETRSDCRFAVRPIRPGDEEAVVDMLQRSSMEDVRLRFFAPRKTFDHEFVARFTQVAYDNEMALVALVPGESDIFGVVRLITDEIGIDAEFAIIVRSDMKGSGLGYSLMLCILDYARARGIGRVFADVLAANTTMLQMAAELGFKVRARDLASGVVTVELTLTHVDLASRRSNLKGSSKAERRMELTSGSRPPFAP